MKKTFFFSFVDAPLILRNILSLYKILIKVLLKGLKYLIYYYY